MNEIFEEMAYDVKQVPKASIPFKWLETLYASSGRTRVFHPGVPAIGSKGLDECLSWLLAGSCVVLFPDMSAWFSGVWYLAPFRRSSL